MSQNYKDLKYLSQSVLLEESGLPHFNTVIVILVTLALAAFIGWSVIMPLDEVVAVTGNVSSTVGNNGTYDYYAHIPSDKVHTIAVGNQVMLSIPGVTDKSPLSGKIANVDRQPTTTAMGQVYYVASVELTVDPSVNQNLSQLLYPSMETRMDIVVGSKTLMTYFMGKIFDVKNHAFSEQ